MNITIEFEDKNINMVMYEYSKSTRNYRQDSLTNIWTHFIRRLDKIPLPRWFCSSGPMDRRGGAPRPNDRRWEDPSSWRVIERLKLHLFWCSDFNNNTDMFVQTKPVWHWHKTLTSCTEENRFWYVISDVTYGDAIFSASRNARQLPSISFER